MLYFIILFSCANNVISLKEKKIDPVICKILKDESLEDTHVNSGISNYSSQEIEHISAFIGKSLFLISRFTDASTLHIFPLISKDHEFYKKLLFFNKSNINSKDSLNNTILWYLLKGSSIDFRKPLFSNVDKNIDILYRIDPIIDRTRDIFYGSEKKLSSIELETSRLMGSIEDDFISERDIVEKAKKLTSVFEFKGHLFKISDLKSSLKDLLILADKVKNDYFKKELRRLVKILDLTLWLLINNQPGLFEDKIEVTYNYETTLDLIEYILDLGLAPTNNDLNAFVFWAKSGSKRELDIFDRLSVNIDESTIKYALYSNKINLLIKTLEKMHSSKLANSSIDDLVYFYLSSNKIDRSCKRDIFGVNSFEAIPFHFYKVITEKERKRILYLFFSISRGAINKNDKFGNNILHYISSRDDFTILLRSKANIQKLYNKENNLGYSPVDIYPHIYKFNASAFEKIISIPTLRLSKILLLEEYVVKKEVGRYLTVIIDKHMFLKILKFDWDIFKYRECLKIEIPFNTNFMLDSKRPNFIAYDKGVLDIHLWFKRSRSRAIIKNRYQFYFGINSLVRREEHIR